MLARLFIYEENAHESSDDLVKYMVVTSHIVILKMVDATTRTGS